MKLLKLATLSIVAAASLQSLISCTSDANPFDVLPSKVETPSASIRLNFNVAATRADDPFSTTDEKKLTKVNIYVFNEAGVLELCKENENVVADTPIDLEVDPGTKTIYAISAKVINELPKSIGTTTISNFETAVFDSKTSNLQNSNGFVMVGKSNSQQVFRTTSKESIPSTNVFSIKMERLVAKTQVKIGALHTEDFGFKAGNASFWVSQTSTKMSLLPNKDDLFDWSKYSNGTYEGYTVETFPTQMGVYSGSFTADRCLYLSENIVKEPKAGNTTFVVLGIALIPTDIYTCDNSGNLSSTPNTDSSLYSYFAVAIVDRNNGLEDFAIDTKDNKKHVVIFSSKADADRYTAALNGGKASTATVSEYDSPMKVVAAAANANGSQFETVTFSNNIAYYRINISDETGALKVERNKYYKITVNSITSLGCNSEDLLRPTDPTVDPTASPTTAMVNAMFKVAEWNEVDKGVDL